MWELSPLYTPDDKEITAIITVLGTCASLYQSWRAKHMAKDAKASAQELVTLCSFPTCGHVCPDDDKRPTLPPRSKQPKLPPVPGMQTE